ncbi:hypothetical protein V8G54_031807 [Vigna mungo]|uniref:Uncharacterized protein n=1 Tax=Vigna mungo TaxID=3915 RepID=A0AAQ3MKU5_VIGMU
MELKRGQKGIKKEENPKPRRQKRENSELKITAGRLGTEKWRPSLTKPLIHARYTLHRCVDVAFSRPPLPSVLVVPSTSYGGSTPHVLPPPLLPHLLLAVSLALHSHRPLLTVVWWLSWWWSAPFKSGGSSSHSSPQAFRFLGLVLISLISYHVDCMMDDGSLKCGRSLDFRFSILLMHFWTGSVTGTKALTALGSALQAPPALEVRNTVVSALNILSLLLGVAVVASSAYIHIRGDSDCQKVLQVPLLVGGIFLVLVSTLGIVGLLYRVNTTLYAYLFAMFTLIVGLAFFTEDGAAGFRQGYDEYRVADFFHWLQCYVVNNKNWDENLANNGGRNNDFLIFKHLSTTQSDYCKPPSYCGFIMKNANEKDRGGEGGWVV